MTATPATPRTLSPRFIFACVTIAVLGAAIFMAAAALIAGKAHITYKETPWALAIHLGTVIPALLLGGPILLMKKGTALHKALGRFWATLMMVTALSSFWLQGLIGTIGPIHIFSVVTLVSIPRAIWAIRKGDVRAHQRAMIGPYVGLLAAGLFAFIPGRLLSNIVLSWF